MGYAVKLQKKGGSNILTAGSTFFCGDKFYYKYTNTGQPIIIENTSGNLRVIKINASSNLAIIDFTNDINVIDTNLTLQSVMFVSVSGTTLTRGISIDGGSWSYETKSGLANTGYFVLEKINAFSKGKHNIRLGFKISSGYLKLYSSYVIKVN